MLKNVANHVSNNATATIRKNIVEAFMTAWDIICSKANCASAASQVGLYPVDRSRPKGSPHVREFSELELQEYNSFKSRNTNRLSINGCVITEQEKIEDIRKLICLSHRDKHLTDILINFHDYITFLKETILKAVNVGMRLLSHIPPIGVTRTILD